MTKGTQPVPLGTRLARRLAWGAVVGLLAAGLTAVPALRSTVWRGSSAAVFGPIPEAVLHPVAQQRSTLVAADGTPLAVFFLQDRVPVALSQVAPVMQSAVLGAEDARFYTHAAIDPRAVLRAALADIRAGRVVEGASTVTQQYVKVALLLAARTEQERQAAGEATLARKVREARYALALETTLSKDEILSRYLNLVYFGHGAWGVETAAERYFSTTASRLTLPQAALLALLIRDPAGNDPFAHPAVALEGRNRVLTSMARAGLADEASTEPARRAPLGLRPRHVVSGCAGSRAPFFCVEALRTLVDLPALGATRDERFRRLFTGGLVIGTTLQPRVQLAAQRALLARVPARGAVAAALDVVEPGNGSVRAMAVSKRFGRGPDATQVNLATGGISGFPAGSTFKVFTLAAALEKGIPLSLRLTAPPVFTASGFRSCETGRVLPPYTVHNAEDSEGGVFTLKQATWESVNTYYVQLERMTGLCRPAAIAEALGVRRADGRPLARFPSLTLGTNEVNPLDMAGAFAALAAHGTACASRTLAWITLPGGTSLTVPPRECHAALPARLADQVTRVLAGVIDGPDPHRTGRAASIGRPAAGKTGTHADFSSAWFCGFTRALAACVWIGDPRGGFGHPMRNITIGGKFYPHVYGATLPAPIWADLMRAVS